MSFFKDLVSLANAGYSPAEVKELMQAAKDAGYDAEDNTKVFKASEEQPAAKENDNKKDDVNDGDNVDYKALYEATKKDLESLQQDNTKENIKPKDVDRDALFKNIKASIC